MYFSAMLATFIPTIFPKDGIYLFQHTFLFWRRISCLHLTNLWIITKVALCQMTIETHKPSCLQTTGIVNNLIWYLIWGGILQHGVIRVAEMICYRVIGHTWLTIRKRIWDVLYFIYSILDNHGIKTILDIVT